MNLLATASLVGIGFCMAKLLDAPPHEPPRRPRPLFGPRPHALPAAATAAESIRAFDSRFNKYVLGNSRVEWLWTGARWAEGPAWFGDLGLLVFSDIPNDRILKYDERSGRMSLLRHPAGYANGNTRDRAGRLITCRQDTRDVVRAEHDGRLTVLAATFDGKPLNGPNDVVVKSNDSIWFSDPGYGLESFYEFEHQSGADPLPRAIYRLDPQTGALRVVGADEARPNGLAFSPDEKILYVSDTGITDGPDMPSAIIAYDVGDEGTLANRRILCDLKTVLPAAEKTALDLGPRALGAQATPRGDDACGLAAAHPDTTGFLAYAVADGIRVDADGNVWTGTGWAGPASNGVLTIAPDGAPLGRILTPETVANIAFGGAKRNRLFMAASTSLYAMYLNIQGAGAA